MRRITLAYPWQGHAPDETVEVDDATAKRLLRGGRARPADPASPPSEAPTPTAAPAPPPPPATAQEAPPVTTSPEGETTPKKEAASDGR